MHEFKGIRTPLIILAGIFALAWWLPPIHALQGHHLMSLPAHILLEVLSIVVSLMICGLLWNSYHRETPASHMALACALLAVAILDFHHTLSYQGMPALITESGPEKAINFWLSARLLFALAMLQVAILPDSPLRRPGHRHWLLAAFLALTGLIVWLALFQPRIWPRTFIAGQGLTPFKIGVEYLIIAILALAAILFYRQRRTAARVWPVDLLLAVVLTSILSELAFTLYAAVTDIFNLLGHIYKVAACIFLYQAVFSSTVRMPFARLRESEARFQTIMDNMDALVYVADMDNHDLLFLNRFGRELFGEDAVGKKCWQVLQQGQNGPCPFCTNDKLRTPDGRPAGVYIWKFENTVSKRWFDCRDQAIHWPDGRLVRLEIATDISKLKSLEDQLRQAQKMEAIGALAGGIAHDFNNILTPILGYSALLADALPADSPLRESAQEIGKAGLRAKELVKQILSFSRQTEKQLVPLQIHLIVKEALKLLRASLPTTIEIREAIDPQDDLALADPTMIHQIMMNLCTNAFHAMKETGGVLAVSLDRVTLGADDYIQELQLKPGPYLRLAVSDSGCGIPRQIMDRIFDPYFTTKAKGEGTGLGLPTVHGIVRNLGGHITVYSEEGKGTTVHVYLPSYRQAQPQEQGQGQETPAPMPRATGDERILVVDDDEVITDMLEKILHGLGYRVTACSDPGQALQQFEAEPDRYDLVISDITMPHLNGVELASRLLAIRPKLPIIFCTGFSDLINEKKMQAMGVKRLLMKPVMQADLAKAIREVLDQG